MTTNIATALQAGDPSGEQVGIGFCEANDAYKLVYRLGNGKSL